MSKVKFTPGPWYWREELVEEDGSRMRTLAPGVLILDDAGGGPWGDALDRANARLIAAAPDLYRAVAAMLPLLQDDGDALSAFKGDALKAICDKARAALAKADGGAE